MRRRTSPVLGVLLLCVGALAACGDDGGGASGGTSPSDFVGTVPVFFGDRSWSPAHDLPPDIEEEILADLDSGGLAIPLPSAAPIDHPDTAEATFWAMTTAAPGASAKPTQATVRVATADLGDLVVVSTPAPIFCGDGPSVTIRGHEGCSQPEHPWGAQIWWYEDGREFHAAVGSALSLEEAVAWLGSWRLVPEG